MTSAAPAASHRVWLRPPWASTAWRTAVTAIAVVAAYHYSLGTLTRSLNTDTPLAYLGLVPLIAAVLVALHVMTPRLEPSIHDRQLDYIVGAPLIVAALAIVEILPVRMSGLFWLWRVDLLSLPLFVAGAVAIVFGVRMLWKIRSAVLFLFLSWPVPYTILINRWLQGFTNLTLGAVKAALRVFPVASSIGGSDGSLFAVQHGSERFVVSVASACAGVNGVVGFALIGIGFASIVRGKRLPKLLWLASGMLLLWMINIIRILIIFWAGSRWGSRVAIGGLHPVIGLVLFNLGVLAIVASSGRFGLRFGGRSDPGPRPGNEAGGPPRTPRRPAVPRATAALCVVALAATMLGVANAEMRRYALVAEDLGPPRLAPFSPRVNFPTAWTTIQSGSYTWARRYFGRDSTWLRYTYFGFPPQGVEPLFRSTAPVFADVITTSHLNTFSIYGLEDCYRFHGYQIRDSHVIDLGNGVVGTVVSYFNARQRSDWTALYWHWPVKTLRATRYERVVLMMLDTDRATVSAPPLSPSIARSLGIRLSNALRGGPQQLNEDRRLARTRDFLVGFAQAVVSGAATGAGG